MVWDKMSNRVHLIGVYECVSFWESGDVKPQGVACWECFGDVITVNSGSVFSDKKTDKAYKKLKEKKLGLLGWRSQSLRK